MTEKPIEWLLAQGVLGAMALLLITALVWVVKKRDQDRIDHEAAIRKERQDCDLEKKALHEAHKNEMRENGKALMAVTQQLVALAERPRR